MASSMRWDGLEELKAQLRTMPADLAAEAIPIIERAANGAATEVRAAYSQHVLSGRLLGGVIVTHFERGKFTPGAVLKSTSPIAWLFDNGSQARHYISKHGKEHKTGKMWGRTPPTHVFVRTVIRWRRQMHASLKELLVKHGASSVTGEAEAA